MLSLVAAIIVCVETCNKEHAISQQQILEGRVPGPEERVRLEKRAKQGSRAY